MVRIADRLGLAEADDIAAHIFWTSPRSKNPGAQILYWSEEEPPAKFIRPEVPMTDRALVIGALASGRPVVSYAGFAQCRICDVVLGTADMEVHGIAYPERAEHYLKEHLVWTPGCDELLARIRHAMRVSVIVERPRPSALSFAKSVDGDLQRERDKNGAADQRGGKLDPPG